MIRPPSRRTLFLATGAAAALAAVPGRRRGALAAFPERGLRWIVAYPPGGGSDAVARMIGARLAQGLGQPVVIDNRPGGGATLGTDAAAKAPPDGYTVLTGDNGNMVNAIGLFRRLPYDPVRDFRGVGLFAEFPLVIAVPAASPLRTAADWIAAARREPGALPCGTPGVGSPHHLALERLQREVGIRVNVVPYRGGAPGVTDLVAGTLGSMMVDIASAAGALRAGQVRALAVTTEARWRGLPEVPTVREAIGLADYRASAWQGLVAPAATPDAAVRRLSEELARATADPALRSRLAEIGIAPLSGGPAELEAHMAAERAYWVPLIRELDITLDA
jgi:tripartite-type tricarboxylate transporter receptor subunit TctC